MIWMGPAALSTLAVLVTWLWMRRFKNASGSAKRIIYFVVFAVAWKAGEFQLQPQLERVLFANRIEDELLTNTAFKALKDYEPDTYGRVLKESQADLKAGADASAVYARMGREVAIVLEKRLPTTSNAAAASFMKVKASQVKYLFDQKGELCYLGIHPELVENPAALNTQLSDSLQDQAHGAMAHVMRDAHLKPMAPVTEAQMLALRVAESIQLKPEEWEEVKTIGSPKKDLTSRRRECEVWLKLHNSVLGLSEDQTGAFVRFQFTRE